MGNKSYRESGTPDKQVLLLVFVLDFSINHRIVNESFLVQYLESNSFILDLKKCIDQQTKEDCKHLKVEEVFKQANVRESVHLWIVLEDDERFAGYLTPLHRKLINTIMTNINSIFKRLSQNLYSTQKRRRESTFFSINDFFLSVLKLAFKKEKKQGIWFFDLEILNLIEFLDFNLFKGLYLDPGKSECDAERKGLISRLEKFILKKKIHQKILTSEINKMVSLNPLFFEKFPNYLDNFNEDYEEIYGDKNGKSQYEIGDFRFPKIEPSTEDLARLVDFLAELNMNKIDGSCD